MKWNVLIAIGISILVLIIYLIVLNRRDKKELEKTLSEDYTKPNHEHIDTDMDRNT